MEVFESNTEGWLPKTRVLIIELHDRMKPGCSKAVFNAIGKHNFSLDMKGENLIFTNIYYHLPSIVAENRLLLIGMLILFFRPSQKTELYYIKPTNILKIATAL